MDAAAWSESVKVRLPEGLRWLEARESGATWLRSLPSVLDELADRWSLELGEPYVDAHVSFACPATRADATEVVLKVQWPHPEAAEEAAALRSWNGRGYVELLDHDPHRHALLLERCDPGVALSTLDPERAIDAYVALLREQWVDPGPGAGFVTLAAQARRWVDQLSERWDDAGRPFERSLLDATRSLVDELADSQADSCLVNLDLHGGNVLSAQRRPWLAIDPKPVVGERAMSLAPIVRASELGQGAVAVARRLDRLSDELAIDRSRARGWAIVQAVAWSLEGPRVFSRHLDTARWLLALDR
ncbi:MAG: streptomycin 6-kinase N-terminal [Acidimicrobiales bacterium]|nr:streptomycin 6-kinase N-terminal [Acidimicrobiales bacterium]